MKRGSHKHDDKLLWQSFFSHRPHHEVQLWAFEYYLLLIQYLTYEWIIFAFLFRPFWPDHYLAEAKKLKHKADSSVSILGFFYIVFLIECK